MLGGQEHEERHANLEHDVKCRAFQTATAQGAKHDLSGQTEDQAQNNTAEERERKRRASFHQRERARCRSGYRKLERNDTRSVIDERLARQQRLLPLAQPDILRKRHDRHSVGRSESRSQRESRCQGNGRLNPVQDEAHHEHGEQHEAHGQRDNGPSVVPQRPLVGAARFVE